MIELLDRKQVAKILNVSIRTIDRLRESGQLRAIEVRGCVRFLPQDVEAFLRGRRGQT